MDGVVVLEPTAVPTADDMRALGARLADLLTGGDVVVLDGDLGAGKTTMTQGIARGLGVVDAVTSPTFVIARVHATPAQAPALVHVDAYRLGSGAELDDLDLDADVDSSVVVVEWGDGLAQRLATSVLVVRIERPDTDDDETRWVSATGHGPRWDDRDAGAPA